MSLWIGKLADNPATPVPAGLAAHAADCTECAARIEAARALYRLPSAPFVPEDLSSRIMARVEAQTGTIKTHETFRPGGRRRLVGLAAAAALLVVVTAALTLWISGSRSSGEINVHLVLEAPHAQSVAVVGDWNRWQPGAQVLTDPDGDGTWEITIRVDAGAEYRYQFIVDEEHWISDPSSPFQVDDGFGGTNSILDI